MVPGSWSKTLALRAAPECPVSMAPESPSVPRQLAGAVKAVQVAELERVGEQDSGSPTGSVASAVKGTGQERKGAETLSLS